MPIVAIAPLLVIWFEAGLTSVAVSAFIVSVFPVIANTLNCLTRLQGCNTIKPTTAYPSFRGAMTWSINWDKHDGYNFSVPTRAALNALP